ncbi:MAG TPA: hypothetical protein VJJ23_04780 [Candidatus Nanoarchaeia archaeon]|nr:hypothetical protein [Candidatus Nanoarchaeia archaeon]
MGKLNKNQVGLTLGIFSAVMHFAWSMLVLSGFAKVLIDFVLGMHFLNIGYTMQSFSFLKMILLMILGFVSWYVYGYVFAAVWNWISKKT